MLVEWADMWNTSQLQAAVVVAVVMVLLLCQAAQVEQAGY
jgi:hypothetical protein